MPGKNHNVSQLLTSEGRLGDKNPVVALAATGVPPVVHLYPCVAIAI